MKCEDYVKRTFVKFSVWNIPDLFFLRNRAIRLNSCKRRISHQFVVVLPQSIFTACWTFKTLIFLFRKHKCLIVFAHHAWVGPLKLYFVLCNPVAECLPWQESVFCLDLRQFSHVQRLWEWVKQVASLVQFYALYQHINSYLFKIVFFTVMCLWNVQTARNSWSFVFPDTYEGAGHQRGLQLKTAGSDQGVAGLNPAPGNLLRGQVCLLKQRQSSSFRFWEAAVQDILSKKLTIRLS